MYTRNITHELLAALADSPVVFLKGARQTGKTTLVRMLARQHFPARYVTLDNATALEAASSDPSGFLSRQPRPLILDEVQRVPGLLLAIKEIVDRDRKPGRYLLTGSANLLTMPLVNDSLAGRMEILTLWPLSQDEKAGHCSDIVSMLFRNEMPLQLNNRTCPFNLFEALVVGGYPSLDALSSPRRREAWFESYLTTIIERDIRDMTRIQETAAMLQLMRLLASRSATLLNRSEVSRTSRIPNATLDRYMTLLKKVFLIHQLQAWSRNLGKRITKTPKMYMVDSGLGAHLIGADAGRLEREPELAGLLTETYVVNELLKQLTWSSTRAHPFHFRTHSGLEVDLVLEKPSGEVVGVEVKSSSRVTAKQFRGLRALKKTLGSTFRAGVVFYNGEETVPFAEDLYAVPIAALAMQ
ncbi:ATP-binding protein [Desulfoplanes sp.]